MKQSIINYTSLLLYALPYSFILGPFVSEVLILICNFSILFIIIKEKEFYFFKKNLIIFLFLVNIFLIFSSLLSEHILFSLKTSFFYFRWILLVISIYYLTYNNQNFLKYLSFNFFVCFLLFFFDSHYQLIFGQNIVGYEILVPHRISSFFDDELILGGFILKILPLLLFCYFIFKKKLNYPKTLFIILIASSFSVIIISGERSAIYLYLIFFSIFFLINLNKFKKELLYFFLIVFISFGSIYIFSENYKSRIFTNFYNSISNKIFHNEIGRSKFKNFSLFSFEHEKHITSAYLIFKKSDLKTKLIGIGPKNFRNFCGITRFCDYENCCSSHPHNIPVQILAETGLIGLALLTFIYLKIFLILTNVFLSNIRNKKTRTNFIEISLVLGIFILLFPLSTSGNFFHNKFNILLFTLVGFLHSIKLKKEQKNKNF